MGRISMVYVRYVLSMKYGSVLTCELKYVSDQGHGLTSQIDFRLLKIIKKPRESDAG